MYGVNDPTALKMNRFEPKFNAFNNFKLDFLLVSAEHLQLLLSHNKIFLLSLQR